jgi:prevent-host-death family protein
MQYIQSHDARSRLGELLSRVEHGEKFAITRNGREVAVLIPGRSIGGERTVGRLHALRERLREEGRLVPLSVALAWRDAERP